MRLLRLIVVAVLVLPAAARAQVADTAAPPSDPDHVPTLNLGLGTFMGTAQVGGDPQVSVGVTAEVSLRHRGAALVLQRDWGRIRGGEIVAGGTSAGTPLTISNDETRNEWALRFELGPEGGPLVGFAGAGFGGGEVEGASYRGQFLLGGVRLTPWDGLSVRGEVRIRDDQWSLLGLGVPIFWNLDTPGWGISVNTGSRRIRSRELRVGLEWSRLRVRAAQPMLRKGVGPDCEAYGTGISVECLPTLELAVAPFMGQSVLTSNPLLSFGLQAEAAVHWTGLGFAFQYEWAGLYDAAAMDFNTVAPRIGAQPTRPSLAPDRTAYAVRIEAPLSWAEGMTGFAGLGVATGTMPTGGAFDAQFALAGVRYPMTAGTSVDAELRFPRQRYTDAPCRPGVIDRKDGCYRLAGVELRVGLRWGFRLVYDS